MTGGRLKHPAAPWVAATLIVLAAAHAAHPDADPWRELERGLWLGTFSLPRSGERSPGPITVLRVDPSAWSLRLLSATEHGGERLTTREWCRNFGLTAAVNAGMYQTDGLTSVGYMRNYSHVNNPRMNPYKALLAFNPAEGTGLPEVQILDREHQDVGRLMAGYRSLVQGIRMVSLRGENVWAPQEKMWSIAAAGVDRSGRALFIHSAAPHRVHDFIDILLSLPLSLTNAMYLEGGPEASLFVSAGGEQLELSGLPEGPAQARLPSPSWPVPNVIGVFRR